MIVKSLVLENYRNHTNTRIVFSDRFNIIYGDNGQGKTNILEAIYLCASGRSHRTSKDSELIKFGCNKFSITAHILNSSSLDKDIEIEYYDNQKKQIKINEIPIKKIGALMGNLYAVLFSPEDLFIVKQGPTERRRFVDITLSQIKPSYFYNLQQLTKILKQRNTLLKNINANPKLMDTIDIWNIRLAEVASSIIIARRTFSKMLSSLAESQHNYLTDKSEKISFDYKCSFQITENNEKEQIQNQYIKNLEKSLSRDIILGYTTIGPHRDDYDILVNGKSLKLYGSQGQQRSAVLSLKIAEIELVKKETNQYPVLLLDDVMSELDNNRQKYLMESIKEVQTFITCTSIEHFDNLLSGKSNFYKVVGGNIQNSL
ncbi:DNA replication/repair protein RecF [Ruminiclostridium josui]|uniref:DNA replication/repair protein RecF n=1 Tax=Ruminiclostridium josui TaxID=1499 RepID=UPI000464DC7E|nr:DNA replication/repair protein RecF [Ruminiclostridium josui]